MVLCIRKDGEDYPTRPRKVPLGTIPVLSGPMSLMTMLLWLIAHGISLCEEYEYRYNKVHSCYQTLIQALFLFPSGMPHNHTPFTRAMPDVFKHDTSIDTITAYKMYISSKPWVASNYLRIPTRKPEWV